MLYLRTPWMDKHFMLCWAGEDVAEGERFRSLGFANLSRESNYFLQGNGEEWKCFEFWTDDQDLILNECMKIAALMGNTLEIYADNPPLHVMYPSQFTA